MLAALHILSFLWFRCDVSFSNSKKITERKTFYKTIDNDYDVMRCICSGVFLYLIYCALLRENHKINVAGIFDSVVIVSNPYHVAIVLALTNISNLFLIFVAFIYRILVCDFAVFCSQSVSVYLIKKSQRKLISMKMTTTLTTTTMTKTIQYME